MALPLAAASAPPTPPLPPLPPPPGSPPSSHASSLRLAYAAAQADLQGSVFGEPLLLRVHELPGRREAEVLARAPRTLAQVAATLRSPAGLCGMLRLLLNVRQCQADTDKTSDLVLTIGPMRGGLPGLGTTTRLTLVVEQDTPAYFRAQVSAEDGPLGTHDLQWLLEAVAIDARHTVLQIRFGQPNSAAAALAARLYLATAGRNKVGFSVVGHGALGRPMLVDGERGALERNTMRHYLALLAATGARGATPAARLDDSLRTWHALTERHAPQLHELDLAEYLNEKQGGSR